jgi:hypothetical protein
MTPLITLLTTAFLIACFFACCGVGVRVGEDKGTVISASPLTSVNDGNVSLYATNTGTGTSNAQWRALAMDGTGQYLFAAATLYGSTDTVILKSSDYGATWATSGRFDRYEEIVDLFVSDLSSGIVAAVGSSEFHMSSDYGGTWTTTYPSVTFDLITGDATGRYLAATAGNKVILSATYGLTWTLGLEMDFSPSYNGLGVALATDKQRHHIATAVCQSPNAFVCVYSNNNITANVSAWTRKSLSLEQNCRDLTMTMDSTGSQLFMVANDELYRRILDGNWEKVPTAPRWLWWSTIQCDSTCKHIVAAGNVKPYDYIYSYNDRQAVVMSSDYGETWSNVTLPTGVPPYWKMHYTPTISANGKFIASTAQASNVTGEFGEIVVSSDPYLQRAATVLSNSSSAASYSFLHLGYICDGLYLSAQLTLSYLGTDSYVVVSLVGGPEEVDRTTIFEGICAPLKEFDDAVTVSVSDTSTCFSNVRVNRSLIHEALDGGSLTVLTTIKNITAAAVGKESFPCQEYTYFSVDFVLSVQPLGSETSVPLLPLYNSAFINVLVTVAVFSASFGAALPRWYQYCSSEIRSFSSVYSMWYLGTLGFMVTCEIYFLFIFADYGLRYILYFSYSVILARLAMVIPGLFLLIQIFDPSGQMYISTLSSTMEQGFVRKQRFLLTVIAGMLLLDPQLVIFFPWRKELQFSDFHGYPDAKTMDLATMVKGLVSISSLVIQVMCYYNVYALPSATQSQYRSGKQLDIRILMFIYSGVYLVFVFPTLIVLYSHLCESINCAVGDTYGLSEFSRTDGIMRSRTISLCDTIVSRTALGYPSFLLSLLY